MALFLMKGSGSRWHRRLMGYTPSAAAVEIRGYKLARTTETRNTCPYCSVGCGIIMYGLATAGIPVMGLVAGLGVGGDTYYGMTVKHRSRVAKDPTQPNLRQVHLIQDELF